MGSGCVWGAPLCQINNRILLYPPLFFTTKAQSHLNCLSLTFRNRRLKVFWCLSFCDLLHQESFTPPRSLGHFKPSQKENTTYICSDLNFWYPIVSCISVCALLVMISGHLFCSCVLSSFKAAGDL